MACSSSAAPEVLVATPGRLAEVLGARAAAAQRTLLVLDEADRLLEPTQAPHVEAIAAAFPGAQLGLFTATLTPALRAWSERVPRLHVCDHRTHLARLEHVVLVPADRAAALRQWLQHDAPTLVFVAEAATADALAAELRAAGRTSSRDPHPELGIGGRNIRIFHGLRACRASCSPYITCISHTRIEQRRLPAACKGWAWLEKCIAKSKVALGGVWKIRAAARWNFSAATNGTIKNTRIRGKSRSFPFNSIASVRFKVYV